MIRYIDGIYAKKVKLENIALVKSGKRLPAGHSFVPSGCPYITVSDMGEIFVKSNNFSYISPDTEEALKRYKITTGDIIISIAGTLGKINLISDEIKNANLTENCNKITVTDLNVNNLYLFYYLKSPRIQKEIELSGTKSSQPKLALERLRNFSIIIPSLPEQKKIAEFFSALDERIDLQAQKVNLLKEQKKGYKQRVFNRELVFTDDNGNTYPEWEEKKLGEVAKIRKGFTPSTENKEFWNGNIPWLSIAGFGNKYIKEGTKFISTGALGKKSLFPEKSLVMSFKLTLGKLGILEKPMMTNEAICMFDWMTDEVHNDYAYYALDRLEFEKFANRAAAGWTLNDESLKRLPLPLPSLPEQKKIAEFFSALDENIELNERKLELLKEQKKGYLQGIFG